MKVDYLVAEIGSTTTVVTAFNVFRRRSEIIPFKVKVVLQF